MVFGFGSVYMVNYVYRLAYVEPALHPQDKAYFIMVDKLFDVLLQSACQYFIEDFCIYVHHGYWPEVFFFSCVSDRFWLRLVQHMQIYKCNPPHKQNKRQKTHDYLNSCREGLRQNSTALYAKNSQ